MRIVSILLLKLNFRGYFGIGVNEVDECYNIPLLFLTVSKVVLLKTK